MKNIFTEKELECGMFIIRNDANRPFKDLGFAKTVVFKVGYAPNLELKYGLCSILTDGFFTGISKSLKDLAEYLNECKIGYRPITKEEIIQLINSSNQGFY